MEEKPKLSWFKIMWGNFYIQLVILAALGITYCIVKRDEFYSLFDFWFSVGLLSAIIIVIAILGFWKYWVYLKELEKENKL